MVLSAEGLIFWGGSDDRFYEPPLRYVPVQREGFFNVTMDSVEVPAIGPRAKFCRGGCFAIIDSGTSLVGGPTKDVTELNRLLGGVSAEFGEFIVDCDAVPRMPDVHLTFGGQPFHIPADRYILKLPDIDGTFTCISGKTAKMHTVYVPSFRVALYLNVNGTSLRIHVHRDPRRPQSLLGDRGHLPFQVLRGI